MHSSEINSLLECYFNYRVQFPFNLTLVCTVCTYNVKNTNHNVKNTNFEICHSTKSYSFISLMTEMFIMMWAPYCAKLTAVSHKRTIVIHRLRKISILQSRDAWRKICGDRRRLQLSKKAVAIIGWLFLIATRK